MLRQPVRSVNNIIDTYDWLSQHACDQFATNVKILKCQAGMCNQKYQSYAAHLQHLKSVSFFPFT